MKVSVVIPTYNREKVLIRAIESVQNQHVKEVIEEIELIVVDDGSTDGTRELVTGQFPTVKYCYQDNQGVSAARNLGIRSAQHEWIAFLDSDDEWLPDKLVDQRNILIDSEFKVCHTEEVWIRNGVRVNQMLKHKKQGGNIFNQCLALCAMSPSSIVIHRSVFEELGVFDPSLPACEDYDMWLRITARHTVAYVEKACIVKYGGHSDQLSRKHWGMDRFRVRALEKLLEQHFSRAFLSDEQSRLTIKMLKKKNRILMNGAKKRNNDELFQECLTRNEKYSL